MGGGGEREKKVGIDDDLQCTMLACIQQRYENSYSNIPEAFSGLSTVLWLLQTTLIPAVIAGVGSLESNLVLSQITSFPLCASEAGDVKRGLLQEVSF